MFFDEVHYAEDEYGAEGDCGDGVRDAGVERVGEADHGVERECPRGGGEDGGCDHDGEQFAGANSGDAAKHQANEGAIDKEWHQHENADA